MPLATAHILVIEDELLIRRFLSMTLQGVGLIVSEAGTGAQGLVEARLTPHDLILLDLGLPDMDGIALIAALRIQFATPIIVLSAREEESMKVAALDEGADDYLVKPIGQRELLARLRAHLRKRSRETGSSLVQFGDITVDFEARRVSRAGQPVHLTPIEFKLLTVLLTGSGKVLTSTYLLREVWGAGYAERQHYLRIHMGHLRRKLEHDPARPVHIVTETGVGYRLLA